VSAACAQCLGEKCCDEVLDCGGDPECVESSACLRFCFEATCVAQCLESIDNESTLAFMTCSLQGCINECLPQGQCALLGELCCSQIESDLIKAGCATIAQRGDQEACLHARTDTFAEECVVQSDAGSR